VVEREGDDEAELGAYSIWFLLELSKEFTVPPELAKAREWLQRNLPYSGKQSLFNLVVAFIADRPDWLTMDSTLRRSKGGSGDE
jgi:hypothetical protein